MIDYVLFVHKKSVSKKKVCIIFIKNLKFRKNAKKHFWWVFYVVFWVFLGGFFGWVFWVGFYSQPCLKLMSLHLYFIR
jgi:hypothetical protein